METSQHMCMSMLGNGMYVELGFAVAKLLYTRNIIKLLKVFVCALMCASYINPVPVKTSPNCPPY